MGRIHFELKGCRSVINNFFKLLTVHSVSNNAEFDQTTSFAAFDLVLHCLLMSHKMDARIFLVLVCRKKT